MSSCSFVPVCIRILLPVSAGLLLAGVAQAQEVETVVVPDRPQAEAGDARYAIDRTSLYGDDARVPLPFVVVATTSFSYTNIGADPTQVSGSGPTATCGAKPCYSPFSGNTAQPGGTIIVGGELGVLPHLSVFGSVMAGAGGGGGVPSRDLGGIGALRVQVFPNSWKNLHFVVSAGYVREAYNPPVYNDDATPAYWIPGQPGGVNGGYFQLAMSGDVGRLPLGGMFHGQHTFAEGRDPLDITVDLGATYRLVGGFRAGIEYLGQDLEESFSPGAEGDLATSSAP
jgi:hypothetical protein